MAEDGASPSLIFVRHHILDCVQWVQSERDADRLVKVQSETRNAFLHEELGAPREVGEDCTNVVRKCPQESVGR